MMKTILSLLAQADAVMMADQVKVATAPVTGEPENQVVHLDWKDEAGRPCSTILTEEGLAAATFDKATQSYQVEDHEGEMVALKMVSKGMPLTPDSDANVFVIVQEGGSSTELYIHEFEQREGAVNSRVHCAENGSYRTSEIIEVPASLANHPQFNEIVQQLVRATLNLGTPGDE